eukprot:TRINITY_DN8004_c0_g1_i1.p1 TRINITY_DN8004_c0_g1~~TRINITY_DN8004_c0_g1_i1.p1  ORF type:complete len:100 (-),score=20.01 TRINITY_DN8004_c0_g1_i1:16-315(-)
MVIFTNNDEPKLDIANITKNMKPVKKIDDTVEINDSGSMVVFTHNEEPKLDIGNIIKTTESVASEDAKKKVMLRDSVKRLLRQEEDFLFESLSRFEKEN